MDLNDRTVLVTGASSGLGANFAEILAKAGAHVVVAARREDRLAALVDRISAAGGAATAVGMDVTDEASIISAFDAAEAAGRPLNSVIVNAGISVGGPAQNFSADDFDAIMAVNVRGAFLVAREAGRRMMERGEQNGRIVLIASIGGLQPLGGLTAYSASKAAVVMLGRGLAREWLNRGINVNILCPGYVSTELTGEWFETEKGKQQIASFPRRRLMSLSDLDFQILYLSSTHSTSTTGSVIKVDDGQSI